MTTKPVDAPRSPQVPPGAKERRLRFAALYVGEAAGNGALAARLAGYSPNGAHSQATKLLQHPEVQALIADHRAEQAASRTLTRQRQEELLADIAEGRLREQHVDAEGNVIERRGSLKEIRLAIEQLGKRHGHFAEDAARSKGLSLLEEIAAAGAALAASRK